MTDQQGARSVANGAPAWALLAAAVVGLYATGAAALPLGDRAVPPAGVILIADSAPVTPDATQPDNPSRVPTRPDDPSPAPFAELNAALADARARLEELARAAQASAGQARQELDAAKQENERLHAEFATLQQTSQTADARIAELANAAEDAAAEAKRIGKELVTMRWQNAQLNTSLARAQAAREQAVAEGHKTEEALSAKVESLTKSAEQSATEIARLHTALADAEHQLEAATTSRGEAEARVTELQTKLESADTKSNHLDEQLTKLQTQASQAGRERDEARARIAELALEADRLRSALASAAAEAEQATRAKRDLEQEVAELRTAAGSAADAARRNLLAVEARIKELNAALVTDIPAAAAEPNDGAPGTLQAIPAAAPAAGSASDGGPATAAPAEAQPQPEHNSEAPADRPTAQVAATEAPQTAAAVADIDLIKSGTAGDTPDADDLTRVTANLPLEQRLQVQGLLVDLGAKIDARGLALTVPGQGLFATNSDEIEPTAHDTLAKVAELIDAFKGHPVQIIGYTDSIGDATYNKILSQRRATLVRQFFVDNFGIDGQRLATEGRGEDDPIAANDTPGGRQANRRVEVLIQN
jgi:outer membrane protein OmpA-like peptidoglycan-associated protein/uncharacterized coiled-coil DUF342 family protein